MMMKIQKILRFHQLKKLRNITIHKNGKEKLMRSLRPMKTSGIQQNRIIMHRYNTLPPKLQAFLLVHK